jgi:hypothetical protein
MVTREDRLKDFDTVRLPLNGEPTQILCEDHSGTYLVPYACEWSGNHWRGVKSNAPIEARVIGWRSFDPQ